MTASQDQNKPVCIVTGGGGGLGSGIAESLLGMGGHVIVADINERAVREVGERIGGEYRLCDVSDEAQVESLVRYAQDRYGRLDVMCNNAGTAFPEKLLFEADAQEWQRILGVNLMGTLYGLKHAGAVMKRQKSGSIINISSVGATGAGKAPPAYCASKAAVGSVTRSAAREFGPWGIRVNAVNPGLFATSIYTQHAKDDKGKQAIVEHLNKVSVMTQAIARPGVPEDVGQLVQFLASEASSFITGEEITISGGAELGVSANDDPIFN